MKILFTIWSAGLILLSLAWLFELVPNDAIALMVGSGVALNVFEIKKIWS